MASFQRSLAVKEGFCNRISERQQLKNNILNQTHTVIVAPRRYGKTSLAMFVITEEDYPCAHLDLFMKYRREDIMAEFYQQIGVLMAQLIKPSERGLKTLASFFRHVKVGLNLGSAGLSLSVAPDLQRNDSIRLLLEDLERLLAKQQKKVIIFIDEIQTIVDSDMRDEFEADLRFIAQKTRWIIFIFSGSSRHLLQHLFDDKRRPFYKLCQQMSIKKIASKHFQQHINKFAQQQWYEAIEPEALQAITDFTMCHPYYVNVLCEKLFQQKNLPDMHGVTQSWQHVCEEEQSAVARDLSYLTAKQRKCLIEIAKHPGLKKPTAKAFVNKTDLTAKGVADMLQLFFKYDLIEQDAESGIDIVDPVMAHWVRALGPGTPSPFI